MLVQADKDASISLDILLNELMHRGCICKINFKQNVLGESINGIRIKFY